METEGEIEAAAPPARGWPAWLALGAVVAAHAAVMARWIGVDGSFGATICCDLTAPVSRLVVAAGDPGGFALLASRGSARGRAATG